MASIFFDTSAVCYLVENGYKGTDIKELLDSTNSQAVIGRHTLFECAKTYKNDRSKTKANSLLLFIQGLKSEYTYKSIQLFEWEKQFLRGKISFVPHFCGEIERQAIDLQIIGLLAGDLDKLKKFIEVWQESINVAKQQWEPRGCKHEYKNKFPIFEERIKKISHSKEMIEQLRKLFDQVGSKLSYDETEYFFKNQGEYRALRSWFRSYLYLDWSAETSGDVPKEARITDAIQIAEATYCTTFVGNDKDFEGAFNLLNPDLEWLSVEDFLECSQG